MGEDTQTEVLLFYQNQPQLDRRLFEELMVLKELSVQLT